MYDTAITFRTNSKTKRQAQKLFSDLGIDISTALNIFLKKTLQTGGIPFDVVIERPNQTTLTAISDAMNDKNMSGPYESVSDLMEALDAED